MKYEYFNDGERFEFEADDIAVIDGHLKSIHYNQGTVLLVSPNNWECVRAIQDKTDAVEDMKKFIRERAEATAAFQAEKFDTGGNRLL